MEKFIKAIGEGVLYVASIVTFIVAVGLAIADHTASASVMAAMCVTMVLFANLPRLESFKAFGVEAKLREKIAEAQATLDQLRELTLTSARQTYYQLASVGRWADGNIKLKDSLAEELGALLAKFQVDESEVRRAWQPYLQMIRVDLMETYRRVAIVLLRKYLDECQKELSEFRQPINPSDPKWQALIERQQGIGQLLGPFLDPADHSKDRFTSIVETDRFKSFLAEDEAWRLKQIGRALLRLNSDCEKVGHYTPEARELVETYGGYSAEHTAERLQALLTSRYASP